jgi:hypothetical protein
VQWLRDLEIDPKPLATCFIPEANGVLDDYFESWFLISSGLRKKA